MFCPKCGKQLPDGAKFCTGCGSPVSQPQTPPAPTPTSGGKRNTGLIVAIVALVIALLLALAAAAFFLLRGNSAPNVVETQPPLPTAEELANVQPTPVPMDQRQSVSLAIRQVDNSAFPKITFYASALDAAGETVLGLTARDFVLTELISGVPQEQTLTEVKQVQGAEKCSVSLVLDASGSMNSGGKMDQAKAAAQSFLSQVNFAAGDQVEVVSFSDYVYLEQDFTSDYTSLSAAISGIQLYNMTALYDALYSALVQTYAQAGARCVIAFTDGMKNGSNYTYSDVVTLSQSTGIPVYLVGIGAPGDYDEASLRDLAHQCSGEFYSAGSEQISSVLAQIYANIYRQQQEYYIFRYTTSNTDIDQVERTLRLSFSDYAPYLGESEHDYQTQAVINDNFSLDFRSVDYILPNSSTQAVTDAELSGLSLAQLRIARNEIYARHGRQFKDAMLNQWFYSKNWYLSIFPKYSPADFDQYINDLSALERENVSAIKRHEEARMATSDIYPTAAYVELTDYDLALSKTVLQTALDQMSRYQSTSTLQANIAKVRAALNQANISY